MFFSLSSEIVIVTYGDLAERQDGVLRETRRGAARLGSAPLGFGSRLRIQNHFFTLRLGDAIKDLISCVLNTRAGTVKLARRLRGELAKCVTVTQCVHGFKHQF